MATLRDIKRRINAVTNTKQITKAMKMVAASKLRKAQSRMIEMRSYADKMNNILTSLAASADLESHPLLAFRPRKTVEIVVLTSDRGLCGAFNTNVLKAASKFIKEHKEEGFNISLSVIGKKAYEYFKRRDIEIRNSWTGLAGKITFSEAQDIARDIISTYTDETMDEVFLVYNEFRTVMTQEVRLFKLLPHNLPEKSEDISPESPAVMLYEPTQQDICNQLLPKNIEIQVFRAALESQASEEAARMTAMENATKNANEMIEILTLQYNKARQASITAEIMDIVGGVEALKG